MKLAVPAEAGVVGRVWFVIRCLPQSICSWDFLLDGEGHRALLEFNWLSEQGVIRIDGERFDVRKHGAFSGHWTLEHPRLGVVSAQKATPFTRTFEVQDAGRDLVLRADSPFGRSFSVERGRDVIARIAPDHPFTRRATIQFLTEKWDFAMMSFLFWLVVLTWRRAAQSN